MRAHSLETRPEPSGGAGGARRARVRGHFGEILQGRLGAGGPVALLTLAAPGVAALSAEVSWRPAPKGPLTARGNALKALAMQGLRAGLRVSGRAGWGGRLVVETCARPGGGCGASTACLLAALRLGAPGLSSEAEAALLLRLEGAVDPLMRSLPGATLWASRLGRSVRDLAPPPRFLVVGGYDGPGLRTDPTRNDFDDVSDLVDRAARALAEGDAPALAAVAAISAERRQRRAPKRRFADIRAVAAATGALGLVVAHTGPAMGLLFRPQDAEPSRRAAAALARLGLEEIIRFESA